MDFNKKISFQLPDNAFSRADEATDEEFYIIPRFVAHIDYGAIDSVTELYRKYLPEHGDILDLMSSWLSHLPEEVTYNSVTGLGMNEREMFHNKQLDTWSTHNLNDDPKLPFRDNQFDAGIICVSIDYLTNPIAVLQDMGRTLKKDAPLVITYSNRFFEAKATSVWLQLDDEQRAYLIKFYLSEAGSYKDIQLMDCSPEFGDPLYAVVAKNIG
ncbi:MAG: SAM-dependent methyltransferase [Saprospiraceae bacterium]|jgi:SAM-dependent methyltransferase